LALPPLPGVPASSDRTSASLLEELTSTRAPSASMMLGVDVLIRPEDGEPTDPQLADLQPRLTGTAQTSLFLVHRL
jgi:hypothetical protein